MAIFFITGGLGGGKSLCAMMKIREYLYNGRKIATNMNVNLEHLCHADNRRARVIRVPDAPTIDDLKVIGLGSDQPGEKNHGLLVLDELGTWFNARDFGDKGRKDVLKYCIHLRKYRWDVLFLVQDFTMVDKQMRGNITTFLVTCQSSHDLWIFKPFKKFHIATVRLRTRIKTDSWWYRGTDLHHAYDTEQLYFTVESADSGKSLFVDEELDARQKYYAEQNGLYSYLPPGYLSDQSRQHIRDRYAAINGAARRQVVAFVLAAFNLWLWWPAADQMQVVDQIAVTETSDDLQQAVAPPQLFNQPASVVDQLARLQLTSHNRIGYKQQWTFALPGYPEALTGEDLADLGVAVRTLSRDLIQLTAPGADPVVITWSPVNQPQPVPTTVTVNPGISPPSLASKGDGASPQELRSDGGERPHVDQIADAKPASVLDILPF